MGFRRSCAAFAWRSRGILKDGSPDVGNASTHLVEAEREAVIAELNGLLVRLVGQGGASRRRSESAKGVPPAEYSHRPYLHIPVAGLAVSLMPGGATEAGWAYYHCQEERKEEPEAQTGRAGGPAPAFWLCWLVNRLV